MLYCSGFFIYDFKDLFDEPPATLAPSAVKPVKSAAGQPTAAAAAQPTAAAAAQNNEPPSGVPAAKKDVAQFTGKAQATLAWDNVPDAISYNIYWSDQPGVTRENGKKIANVKNPHTLKNLVPGKTYYLVVTAVGKDGESNVSEEISYTVNK